MNARTTHEQTDVTCFPTADSIMQAIKKARVYQRRNLCHQLKKSRKLDLSKPESACALQHHRSNVTTRALLTIASTTQSERFTDAIVGVCSAAPPQQRYAVCSVTSLRPIASIQLTWHCCVMRIVSGDGCGHVDFASSVL